MDRKTKKELEKLNRLKQDAKGFGKTFQDITIDVYEDGEMVEANLKNPTLITQSLARKIIEGTFGINITEEAFKKTGELQKKLKDEKADELIIVGETVGLIIDQFVNPIKQKVFVESVELVNDEPKLQETEYVKGLNTLLNLFINKPSRTWIQDEDMITEEGLNNVLTMIIIYLISPS